MNTQRGNDLVNSTSFRRRLQRRADLLSTECIMHPPKYIRSVLLLFTLIKEIELHDRNDTPRKLTSEKIYMVNISVPYDAFQ